MPTFDDDVIVKFVAAHVAGVTSRPCHVERAPVGVPVDEVDKPFNVVYGRGGRWSRPPLVSAFLEGWFEIQVTSVGKGPDADDVVDYRALAAKVRTAWATVPIAGTGFRILAVDAPEGPPTAPEVDGTLRSVTEVFSLYIEAV